LRSEKASASKSESPNSTTDVSAFDSFNESSAFAAALVSVFAGLPPGKAVLNLPVRRMARL
jgi:hypothetical protein